MQSNLLFALTVLLSVGAHAESFSERNKVTGFHCDYGKAAVRLRSLDSDRVLFLAANDTGTPKFLEMLDEHCQGLTKNLSARLKGQVFDVNFETEVFERKEQVYIPPRNPCRPGRTKCEDGGDFVEATNTYARTETFLDGYRFFNELRQP